MAIANHNGQEGRRKKTSGELEKHLPEAQANWLPETLRKFVQLLDLPPNWDGYSARAVDPALLERAFRVLLDVVPPTAPVPYVVPSPAGGIQVEWHEPAADIELEFKADGTASFFMETNDREVEKSAPIERIGQLARRSLGLAFVSH